MTLRVIAGEFRGRLLKSPRGYVTRPLRAPVREALFNILGSWVEGRICWDLFAGTGASGIEALSRGARHVLFVEKNNQALAVLRENLALLGDAVAGRAEIRRADAWELPAYAEPPELIFLDPPYAQVAEDPVACACRAARLANCLAPTGVLCFHYEEGVLDADDFDADVKVELRRWGRSTVALLGASHRPPWSASLRAEVDQESAAEPEIDR